MKIIFAGTPDFSLPTFQALLHSSHKILAVYTQPDRPAGRGRQLQASPVKQLACQYQLPVLQPLTLRDKKIQDQFTALQPDIMIVIAYGLILPKEILSAPKYGCINVHASLLPRFRGAAPIHRAILAGENETGVTLMQMDEGLDTGAMLHKIKTPIDANDNFKTLHDRLALLGAEGLVHTLDRLLDIQPEIQNNAQATYASKIHKSETFLDFNQTAAELVRAIRAFYPAHAYLNGMLIKIWAARSLSLSEFKSESDIRSDITPGKIIKTHFPDFIHVMTINGVLQLSKLQLPGGKILSAKEMLNSKSQLFSSDNHFKSTPI